MSSWSPACSRSLQNLKRLKSQLGEGFDGRFPGSPSITGGCRSNHLWISTSLLLKLLGQQLKFSSSESNFEKQQLPLREDMGSTIVNPRSRGLSRKACVWWASTAYITSLGNMTCKCFFWALGSSMIRYEKPRDFDGRSLCCWPLIRNNSCGLTASPWQMNRRWKVTGDRWFVGAPETLVKNRDAFFGGCIFVKIRRFVDGSGVRKTAQGLEVRSARFTI